MPTTVEPTTTTTTTTTTARGASNPNPNPSKSLKRTASMASLPTPPATRTRTRTGKGGARGSRASGGSPSPGAEDEHDSDSDLERASAWSGASRKRRKLALDAIAAELAGTEKEEVAFWLNSAPVPRKSTGKANARPRPIVPGLENDDEEDGEGEEDDEEATARKKPRSTTSTSTHGQAPVSPPPSRRSPRRRVQTQKAGQQQTRTQTPRSKTKGETRATTPTRTTQLVAPRAPVTPPRTVKTNGRIRKSQGPGPVRDSPNNPFLVEDSPDGSSWSPAEPKTPPESIEPPTLTYVHRGKKQVHANPHYNPALGGRLPAELPLDHPDFEPSVACAPRLLFPPSRSSARVRGRPTHAGAGQIAPRTPSPSFRDIARAKAFGLDFDEDEEVEDAKAKGKAKAKTQTQGIAENPSPGASTDEELRQAMPRLLRATAKATPAKPKAEREGLFMAVARTRAQRGKAKEES